MKRSSNRVGRVAEQIQRKLAQIIQQEIRDPRLPGCFITISGIDLSKDLGHAKIYFTAYQGEPELVETILNGASGYLRAALARTLDARIMPQLHFVYDSSIEHGRRLSKIINDVEINDPNDVDTQE